MKKIQFKKIFILFVISVILISSVSVVCFAEVGSGYVSAGDVIVFNDDINFSFIPAYYFTPFIFHVFDSSGQRIDFLEIIIDPDSDMISFVNNAFTIDVYDGEWIESGFQTIYIDSDMPLDFDFNAFLSSNSFEPVDNFYTAIYDILMGSIYGNIVITPDMQLSVSLISTILSLLVVLAPVLVGGFIFVWILKRF